jgi:hypothetical protein
LFNACKGQPASAQEGIPHPAQAHAHREVGGIENIASVLKALGRASVSTPLGRDLRATLLTVLLALAVDEDNRVAASKAGLIPLLVHMLGLKDDPVRALVLHAGYACMHMHTVLRSAVNHEPQFWHKMLATQ